MNGKSGPQPALRERIGVDFGARLAVEDAIDVAEAAGLSYIDVRLGDDANHFSRFDDARIARIRERIGTTGIHLGLHTLSAVNVAETAAYLTDAVDAYLASYIDLAGPLGAEWIVVHGGYHFTADYERRMHAGRERLRVLADIAAEKDIRLLLENMNPEPADAEVHYLACDIEECRAYFSDLDPERVRWSFTVNHAHMLPVGIDGFFAAFGPGRLAEVRLADNRGDKEEHLYPGEGTIDFNAMFDLIEGADYQGHYMLAFGDVDGMCRARNLLADAHASRAGA